MGIDIGILNSIQEYLRCGFLDTVMPIITKLGDGGILWILCSFGLLLFPKTRGVGVAMAIGLVLEVVCCNLFLKPFIGRIRPFDINPAVQLLIPPPTDFSFPSGHTGAAFAAVSALYFNKQRMWIPCLLLAVCISFSRLYLYVHYPSDVLAGIVIGIGTGWVGTVYVKRMKQFCKNHGILRYSEKKK